MYKKSAFSPHPWLRNPHLQTIWGVLRRPYIPLKTRRERVELPDGDFIDLEWVGNGTGPLILILHGLEGSIDSHYARGMLRAIEAVGWRGVLMHFRGCSGEPNRLVRGYHSGETEDIAWMTNFLLMREPELQLGVVGVSLGGNVLLKWLGEMGEAVSIKGAVAVSVPFELHKAANRLQSGFSKVYQWYLLGKLRKSLKRKFSQMSAPFDLQKMHLWKTFWEFDDKVTAPLHGFASANEYYYRASSRQFLKHIQTPTLILQALDDPFMTKDLLPYAKELPKCVTLELSEYGGHVGFIGQQGKEPGYWIETRVVDHFKEVFSNPTK